ncbi:MAG: histidine phosphatase family protein [Proteobacteria bacterium]|nr:histidine phosphatase family protein [Pseudomonadota bacterium]
MTMLRYLLTGLVFACLAGAAQAADVVYLVRHAEKIADGTSDPKLTDEGRARVCNLQGFFAGKGLTHVLSSDYHRTRDTATPLAKSLGLKVEEYDPKHQVVLAMMLKNKPGTYLIVGHSNTLPELSLVLGGDDIGPWGENEYDQFFELRFAGGEVTTTKHQSDAQCPVLAE